ncbi:MAG TPA: histidine phosphatase family protein [Candidatus Aphodocola excrementigallinarum]|uniref:Histidine phosphatase family protein n=1 Tax=Candidatus Aphodocola excrementigallinarum TaxID=2840670 RepID=A0A9D1IQC7_9FIRM|nr:histidine phosphatase family protein [Candidatus Aphodocola excrementigallinarum]
MSKLYIVRHGKTDWNEKGLLQGSNDILLSEEGIKEAKELALMLDLNNIDICISSPLKRAKQTASILTQGKVKIIYDDLLKERGFGSYEGKKINQDLIDKCWDYNKNDDSNGLESIKECLRRARVFLNKIKKEYPNKNILIVSHFAFIKALHYNIVGYDENTDFLSFRPKNATLYEYDI